MEYANGPDHYYCDLIDINKGDMSKGQYDYRGSQPSPTAAALFNIQYKTIEVENNFSEYKIDFLKDLMQKVGKKYPIFLGVYYPAGYHAVEIKEITDNYVVISNPWGQIETYTTNGVQINSNNPIKVKIKNYDDFIQRIYRIYFPQDQ
ncbi:MAG: hypothetical protein ACP5RD_06315 [bacterium]